MNGAVTFQNFPPAPNIFNTNMNPQAQLGMGVPQQQGQRRAITGQHTFGQRGHQQQFLNNTKTYPTWSSAPQQSTWSGQTQASPNPWGNLGQRRNMNLPNMNPVGGPVGAMLGKKPPNHHGMNPAMMISPSKFRRSTSFPGQVHQSAIGTKPNLDFSALEDHRDGSNMLGIQQVSKVTNSRWLPKHRSYGSGYL